jgi:acetyltransferase-like isoleucine patch superfamily enzyme
LKYSGGPVYFVPRLARKVIVMLADAFATGYHRLACRAVGARSRIMRRVRIAEPGVVRIGSDCVIEAGVIVGAEIPGSPLTLRDGVQINGNVVLDNSAELEIGSGTLISDSVVVYTHDHGIDPRARPIGYPKSIGQNVWIGARAIILPSCNEIGTGAVIGAGSVVTKNVPEHTVWAGNPARQVGFVKSKDNQQEVN